MINISEAGPTLLNQYRRVDVYVYNDGGRVLLYSCDVCGKIYHHRLSDEWQHLLEPLQRKCLCLNCFTANLPAAQGTEA